MLMPDVNILIYAHREDEKCHASYAKWLKALVDGAEPFALSVLVAVGFVRIVTNHRIYDEPTPLPLALAFIEQMTSHPRCRTAIPSQTHLGEVARLCRAASVTGKMVADALRQASGSTGQLDTKLNPKPKGGRGKKALREETVSKYQAYEWRKLGAVPQEDFELALQQSDKPTTKGIIRATEAPSQFIS